MKKEKVFKYLTSVLCILILNLPAIYAFDINYKNLIKIPQQTSPLNLQNKKYLIAQNTFCQSDEDCNDEDNCISGSCNEETGKCEQHNWCEEQGGKCKNGKCIKTRFSHPACRIHAACRENVIICSSSGMAGCNDPNFPNFNTPCCINEHTGCSDGVACSVDIIPCCQASLSSSSGCNEAPLCTSGVPTCTSNRIIQCPLEAPIVCCNTVTQLPGCKTMATDLCDDIFELCCTLPTSSSSSSSSGSGCAEVPSCTTGATVPTCTSNGIAECPPEAPIECCNTTINLPGCKAMITDTCDNSFELCCAMPSSSSSSSGANCCRPGCTRMLRDGCHGSTEPTMGSMCIIPVLCPSPACDTVCCCSSSSSSSSSSGGCQAPCGNSCCKAGQSCKSVCPPCLMNTPRCLLPCALQCASPGTCKKIPQNALAGCWSFEEIFPGNVVLDESTRKIDGVLNNGISPTQGKVGNGLRFDGIDDFVSILDPLTPASYTISAWVRPVSTAHENNRIIIVRTSAQGPIKDKFIQVGTRPDKNFFHTTYDGSVRTVDGITKQEENKWFHVIATAQSNGLMRIYINGKEEGTPQSVKNLLLQKGDRYYIGSRTQDFRYFRGTIDEVSLWHRVLSPQEIMQVYNAAR